MYTKRFNSHKDKISSYIDEFEPVFAQLERMGDDTKIPESHKAPLLIASMGNNSVLESTIAAMRTKNSDQFNWQSVTADLIQEWNQWKMQNPYKKSTDKSKFRNKFQNHKSSSENSDYQEDQSEHHKSFKGKLRIYNVIFVESRDILLKTVL